MQQMHRSNKRRSCFNVPFNSTVPLFPFAAIVVVVGPNDEVAPAMLTEAITASASTLGEGSDGNSCDLSMVSCPREGGLGAGCCFNSSIS